MSALNLISRTKLYWGLLLIFALGAVFSPVTSSGRNIFLSYGNLTDVLRQVSITGLVATGMTLVILVGGIDLSVGSVMAFSTVVCAMLLTKAGWTAAAVMGVPATAIIAFVAVASLAHFIFKGLARGAQAEIGRRSSETLDAWRGRWLPLLFGLVAAALVLIFLVPQVSSKFGVVGVILVTACAGLLLGSLNGLIIVAGRLQPFIVTLAMMVGVLGAARLTAGQDSAVLPVYTGTNATENFEVLRSMIGGVIPVPGVFFLAAICIFGALLRFTSFGRYIYAIGGNEEAAILSGIRVARVKMAAYLFSGMLAGIAGVLFVAQYRQGKPDAGTGLELDAIAAVVIGGTSLMGGRGGLAGTLVGVLIFGLLSDILQLHNINSNLQLVLKGMIIVGTVLVQERNLGHLIGRWRLSLSAPRTEEPRSAVDERPSPASPSPASPSLASPSLASPSATPQTKRENAHETA
ncbi:monosaccharide ABC transporter membrane protein, CUT2 family [Rhizobiales bacterium GAS191]|nr:monosaccharide ABC transporter membrane protein, CUT2 family [Rhizobiales bacterium GAS191]